jgi:hypothetical protein
MGDLSKRDVHMDMWKIQPPFTYFKNVDLSSVDYVPTGYRIVSIMSSADGLVKLDTPDVIGGTLQVYSEMEFPLIIKKIYKTGTDAGLASTIWVFGFPDASAA